MDHEEMNSSQSNLLTALKAAGWGDLPWSASDANRHTLRIDIPGGYTLLARLGLGGEPEVSFYSAFAGCDAPHVKQPADALRILAQWGSEHATQALKTRKALRELRTMAGCEVEPESRPEPTRADWVSVANVDPWGV